LIFQAIVMILAGSLIAVAGYLIRVRGMLHLIAGYDEDTVTDKEGLQRFAGNGIFALAGILIVGAIVVAFTAGSTPVATTALVATWVIFVIATGLLVLGAQRYSR
jgi:uncharacterized membrane protein